MVKLVFTAIIALLIASIALSLHYPVFWFFVLGAIFLLIFAIYDYTQPKHSIVRNFPLLGRTRFLMEDLRPKIYQYFVESDTNGKPLNRQQRNIIYQRAKQVIDTTPFGTQLDVYDTGYEYIAHSMRALDSHDLDENPRVRIGSPDCSQPYMASILNISAMSFGSLSKNAILALNGGAKLGNFAHNTGEGGLSPHHLKPGGDVIWNIGTGYFSCRNKDGSFSEAEFEKRATLPNVKMIEIKFSQGAKPGHGGILPKKKVTEEIAKIRLVEMGADVVSPPKHSAFDTAEEFVAFVAKLRKLSGGKPIGMKLCVGRKDEFIDICKAMVSANTYVDFISVDGGEGGTGAAPLEFTNSVGMPLQEGIVFIYDTLKGFGIKKYIKIICSGKIVSGFDIVRALSLGADLCYSARGMMLSLGCIQALECNLNTCPTGIATQNPRYMRGLVVEDKKTRVANYHRNTVKAAVEMMAAAGLEHPDEIQRDFIYRRVNSIEIKTLEELYPEPVEGSMI